MRRGKVEHAHIRHVDACFLLVRESNIRCTQVHFTQLHAHKHRNGFITLCNGRIQRRSLFYFYFIFDPQILAIFLISVHKEKSKLQYQRQCIVGQ